MKSFVALFATSLLFSQGSALVLGAGQALRDVVETRSETCGDRSHAVAFLRALYPNDDHFYTTDASEMQHATTYLGYHAEGTAAYVFPTQEQYTVPLYRLDNIKNADHFYTTSSGESDNAAAHLGYRYEGIQAYIYPNQVCGSVPLYRLYNGAIVDHFYTISETERDQAYGYQYEGIAGYVLPA